MSSSSFKIEPMGLMIENTTISLGFVIGGYFP